MHWPETEQDIEEGWQAIAELIEADKVRWGGVSNFSIAQMERVRPIHRIASLQPPYSMIRRAIEQAQLPYCARQNVGILCYSPIYKGLLTGTLTRQRLAALPENDHRRRDRRLMEPELSANLDLVEALQGIAEREGRSMSDLAIGWVLYRPEVTAAIVGARRPEQIEETAGIGDGALSGRLIETINDLLNKSEETRRKTT